MKQIGAYTLTASKSGKFYVGSTGDLQKRIDRHMRSLRNGEHHCLPLQDLWRRGEGIITSFYPTNTREEAYLLEQDLLDRYSNSSLLLNICLTVKGGDNLSRHPNREKIIVNIKKSLEERFGSLTLLEKKQIYGRPGALNGMFGRTHTESVKKRLSEASKGITRRSGFKLTEHHRFQLSENAKLRVGSLNPFYGKTHTDETKRRMSEIKKSMQIQPANSKKVLVNGQEFVSLTEAARYLQISPALMIYRIKSDKKIYEGYQYVD